MSNEGAFPTVWPIRCGPWGSCVIPDLCAECSGKRLVVRAEPNVLMRATGHRCHPHSTRFAEGMRRFGKRRAAGHPHHLWRHKSGQPGCSLFCLKFAPGPCEPLAVTMLLPASVLVRKTIRRQLVEALPNGGVLLDRKPAF